MPKPEQPKLELTRRECEAVASYIWNASRGSPNGLAFKTWQKMWKFINMDAEQITGDDLDAAVAEQGEFV
jgi:hypothetical protein